MVRGGKRFALVRSGGNVELMCGGYVWTGEESSDRSRWVSLPL